MRTFYEDGQIVEADDLNNDGYNSGSSPGVALTLFTGFTECFPAAEPLTFVPGTGLSVIAGAQSGGQLMLIRDANGQVQVADDLAAQTLTFEAADPSQNRIDLISGVYNEVPVGSIPRDYMDEQGNVTPLGVDSHYVGRSIAYTVTAGTPGGTVPAAPAGTYALAAVTVEAGATSISTQNIVVIPPSLLQAMENTGAIYSEAQIQAIAQGVAGPSYPAITSADITVPAIGATVTIPVSACAGYITNMALEVNNSGNGFTGVMTNFTTNSSGYITSITMTNTAFVGSATAGTTIPGGTQIVYNFSASGGGGTVAPAYGVSYTVTKQFAVGAKSGSIDIGPLPGDSSTEYTIVINGSLELQDGGNSIIWTGDTVSNVTWPNSPQTYNNGQAATFPFAFYGTAKGGTTPTASWSTGDELGYTPMTAVMTAYVNPA